MKKIILFVFILLIVFLAGCESEDIPASASENSDAVLQRIIENVPLEAGIIYSDADPAGNYYFSDKMKANMFGRGNNAPAFKHIVSSAAYFSRKFSDSEIVVLKLTDKSHRAEVMDMCRSRAAKKKSRNAVVYADGVYVYLICCENSADIVNFIKRMS